MGDNLPSIGPVRRPSHSVRAPGGGGGTSRQSSRPSNPAARRRWRKIRFAIAFISKAKIPDGPKGEMCRAVQDDVDFGRFFLMGSNPSALSRCARIPGNFAVTDRDVEGYLSPGKTLDEAAAVRLLSSLWPPCVMGQAIIFSSCGFFFLSSSSFFFFWFTAK